jgi:hypothetical protein
MQKIGEKYTDTLCIRDESKCHYGPHVLNALRENEFKGGICIHYLKKAHHKTKPSIYIDTC